MTRARSTEDPTDPPLHDSFERLLQVTRDARRHGAFVRRAGLTDTDLTRGESFVLAEIVGQASVRPSDLAASLGLDRSIASRQVDRLIRSGLVERTPDPSDGRAALLKPTRRGRSVVTRLRAERERWLDDVMTSLTPSEVADLTRLLPQLVAAIEAYDADG